MFLGDALKECKSAFGFLVGALIKKRVVFFPFCSSAHKRKPMPKVVYNLLSDRDLKKKLKEHGLSSHGSRQQLIKRHQEFVHVYNAQCDSLNPKSGKLEVLGKFVSLQALCMRLCCLVLHAVGPFLTPWMASWSILLYTSRKYAFL